jgi:hypothetical protein
MCRAPLAVAEEAAHILDEVAPPRRGQELRSPFGDRIRGHDSPTAAHGGQPPRVVEIVSSHRSGEQQLGDAW